MPLPKKRIIPKNAEKNVVLAPPSIVIPPLISASSLMTVESIEKSVKKCHQCNGLNIENPSLEQSTLSVPSYGDLNSKIFLIGQSPCTICQESQIPFTKGSGVFLDEVLHYCNTTREQVFITYTVRCHLPDSRQPTEQEKLNCRIYLERELEIAEPEVVIPLGLVALRFFFPKIKRISDWIGKIISTERFYIAPMLHPFEIYQKRDTLIKTSYQKEIVNYKEQMKSIFQLLEKKMKDS